MSAEQVPPVFEDPAASTELRQFVELARRDGPSQEDLQRLAALVGAATGNLAAITPRPTAELGTAPEHVGLQHDLVLPSFSKSAFERLLSSTATKWLAAVGLSAGLGIGAWSLQRTQTGARHSAAESSDASTRPPPPAISAPNGAPGVTADVPVMEPPDPPAATDGTSAANDERLQTRPALRARERRVPRAPSNGSPRDGVLAQPSELSLMQQAEAARGKSARALDLLQEHARLYPTGALAQEREALAIEVLLRAGELERAKSRAGRFAEQHPNSAHLPRVRALIERAGEE